MEESFGLDEFKGFLGQLLKDEISNYSRRGQNGFEELEDLIISSNIDDLISRFPSSGSKIPELLIEKYGTPEHWEIDHLKFTKAMVVIALQESVRHGINFRELRSELSEKYQALKDENYQLLQLVKKMAVLADTKVLSESEAKIIIDLIQARSYELASSLDNYKNQYIRAIEQKNIGRPPSLLPVFKTLDWLISMGEFKSINSAVEYLCESPMWRYKNTDSLKRQYREYRKKR